MKWGDRVGIRYWTGWRERGEDGRAERYPGGN